MVDWKKENFVYLLGLTSVVFALVFVLSWASGSITGNAIDEQIFELEDVPTNSEEAGVLAQSKFTQFIEGDNFFANTNRFFLNHQTLFLFLFNQPYSLAGVFLWTVFIWFIFFSVFSNLLRGLGVYRYGLNFMGGFAIAWLLARIAITPLLANLLMTTLLKPENGAWKYVWGVGVFFGLIFVDLFVKGISNNMIAARKNASERKTEKIAKKTKGETIEIKEQIKKLISESKNREEIIQQLIADRKQKTEKQELSEEEEAEIEEEADDILEGIEEELKENQ